jgi:hypothetical protein
MLLLFFSRSRVCLSPLLSRGPALQALPYYEIFHPGRLELLFPGHSIEPVFASSKSKVSEGDRNPTERSPSPIPLQHPDLTDQLTALSNRLIHFPDRGKLNVAGDIVIAAKIKHLPGFCPYPVFLLAVGVHFK